MTECVSQPDALNKRFNERTQKLIELAELQLDLFQKPNSLVIPPSIDLYQNVKNNIESLNVQIKNIKDSALEEDNALDLMDKLSILEELYYRRPQLSKEKIPKTWIQEDQLRNKIENQLANKLMQINKIYLSNDQNQSNVDSCKIPQNIEARTVTRQRTRPVERQVERPVERSIERPVERPVERQVETQVESPTQSTQLSQLEIRQNRATEVLGRNFDARKCPDIPSKQGHPHDKLKALAREFGLDPKLKKADLCRELAKILTR